MCSGGRYSLPPARSIQSTEYAMKADSTPSRYCNFRTSVRAAGLIAVCLAVSIAATAKQPSVDAPAMAAKVSLSGFDLTTSAGIAAARERLQDSARQFCSRVSGNLDAAHRADFLSCIDGMLKDELAQVSSSARAAIVAHGSAWPAASAGGAVSEPGDRIPDTTVITVSIADVDLKSAQGVIIAEKRIHKTARRLCSQINDG